MTNTAKPSELLPPLPKPFDHIERTGMWNGSPREGRDAVFDDDQMFAFAREAIRLNRRPPSSEQAGNWVPSDSDISAWLERHDFDCLPMTDARAMFEDARAAHMIEAAPAKPCDAEGEPDKYCITAGDYSCISDDPRCMHNRPEPHAASDIYCDVEAGKLRGDELFFPQSLAQPQRQGRAVGYVSKGGFKMLCHPDWGGAKIERTRKSADDVALYKEQPTSATISEIAIHKIVKKYLTKRNQGYFMGEYRYLLKGNNNED